MLQDFIELVERYEPGYSRKIQGASPEEIQHLEQLVGRRLPVSYREFLQLMGRSTGDLQVEGMHFDIARIIDFSLSGHWTPPAGYILFGIQAEDPCLDYYLACTAPSPQDCPVVRFPSEGSFSTEEYFYSLDPSLKDFLLSLAFSEKRMGAFDFERVFTPSTSRSKGRALVSTPAEIVGLVNKRALQLGFERVAPSSIVYRFYDHTDAAIYVRFDESEGNLAVALAARTTQDLERMGDILCYETSLVVT